MGLCIRGRLRMVSLMAKAGSSIRMKTFIRDSGRMAKNMDMGSILISRARFIKANGLMI